MPELPEVEVVRRGLDKWATGRTIASVKVFHSRAVRNHVGSTRDFQDRLKQRTIVSVSRRGKFMWLTLDDASAILTHLGMSGQVLLCAKNDPPEKHVRIQFRFTDDGHDMFFVDQRTFGGMAVEDLHPIEEGQRLPTSALHIARDPLDPFFDLDKTVAKLRSKQTQVKRALLDQSLVSGIGNIYADESLWRSKLHWATQTATLSRAKAVELIGHASEVMSEALALGGTSFDSLYVNVNGESGYFSINLAAYGRQDEPCNRCGSLIVREAFANRSSFRCRMCQRAPRNLGH